MRHARPVSSVAEIYESMDYGPAPESAAAAQAWLESHARKFDLYIGGRWVSPAQGSWFATLDPSKNRELAKVAQADKSDVDAAVAAARAAQPAWAALPGHVRARYLYAIARLVQRHARLLSVVETLDNGKPIRETRTSTSRSLPATSITTPAGRSSWTPSSWATSRSASSAR